MSASGRRIGLVVALLLAGAAACGDDDPGPLDEVEGAMADVDAGTIELELSAFAGEDEERTGPVGFRLEGPFSLAGDDELAVFDLEYTQLLGDEVQATRVASTGREAFLTLDGTTYRVPDAEAASLRLRDGDGGFGDLGIADWALDVEVADGPEVDGRSTERFTGQVDVAELLADLARLAGPLGGDEELEPLDEDTGKRLQELVRASRIEVLADAEDHSLRSLMATVDFGADVPDVLRRTLGAYASTQIRVDLALVGGDPDLSVDAPDDAVDLP